MAQILALPASVRFGPFHGVELDNAVTLIFIHDEGEFPVIDDAFF